MANESIDKLTRTLAETLPEGLKSVREDAARHGVPVHTHTRCVKLFEVDLPYFAVLHTRANVLPELSLKRLQTVMLVAQDVTRRGKSGRMARELHAKQAMAPEQFFQFCPRGIPRFRQGKIVINTRTGAVPEATFAVEDPVTRPGVEFGQLLFSHAGVPDRM